MAVSPSLGSDGVVSLQIMSDGNAIPDTTQVMSVSIVSEMNRIPQAVITIADGDLPEGTFPHADSALFAPGATIEIKAGYGDAGFTTLFSGVVVAMRIRIGGEQTGELEVTCRHPAFRLTLGRRNRVHANMSDSDVMSTLIGAAKLSADVTATTAVHPELVQYGCTDWDFILARAEVSGMLICPAMGKLSVMAPDYSPAPVLSVTYGDDIIAFDGEIDASSQFAKITATGWDIASQATVSSDASGTAGGAWGNLETGKLAAVGGIDVFGIDSAVPLTSADLEGIAKARQARAALARIRGRVEFQGSGLATLGSMLELKGLGDRFNGVGLICSVRHRIENGNWTTEAGLGLDPDWLSDRHNLETPAAAGLTAPARGLQVGKVTKLTEDPQAQNRIQVSLPLLGAAGPVWARLGGAYCSNGAGVMFLPEIGDEVVVAFFNDDPGHPVVLGSLHSTKSPPPLAATAENYVKTIVTPKKLKVTFDDEKKQLSLATPAGNTVVLDDEAKSVKLTDQNGNSVELASAGITLNSAGDITIKAAKGVNIQATADLTLAGLNVTATADAQFSASGNASAELKASGQVKIQGALVMIN